MFSFLQELMSSEILQHTSLKKQINQLTALNKMYARKYEVLHAVSRNTETPQQCRVVVNVISVHQHIFRCRLKYAVSTENKSL